MNNYLHEVRSRLRHLFEVLLQHFYELSQGQLPLRLLIQVPFDGKFVVHLDMRVIKQLQAQFA
jgi:hypothetical protein